LKEHNRVSEYVCIIRYERDKTINDYLSSIADLRVIWGGDETIASIRESRIGPRTVEILFSDRFSISVIDSDYYLSQNNKKIIENFYNDTYYTDQNACSSPKLVVWTGTKIEEASELFWSDLHDLVISKYSFQAKQGVDKLLLGDIAATKICGIEKTRGNDNLITRFKIQNVESTLFNYFGNSGFFYEYECSNIKELSALCNNIKCQTITYVGNREMFRELLQCGLKGIDRIVPVGSSMDFELIWDGYDLLSNMCRNIRIK
jgi:hypothetical protein